MFLFFYDAISNLNAYIIIAPKYHVGLCTGIRQSGNHAGTIYSLRVQEDGNMVLCAIRSDGTFDSLWCSYTTED